MMKTAIDFDELRRSVLLVFSEAVLDRECAQEWAYGDLQIRLCAIRFHVRKGSRPEHHFEYKLGNGEWKMAGTAQGAAGIVVGYILAKETTT